MDRKKKMKMNKMKAKNTNKKVAQFVSVSLVAD